MEFIVRLDGQPRKNALRLLAEALKTVAMPEGWSFATSPLGIFLIAPDPDFAEGSVRVRHYERNKLAHAELLVRAACNGRPELMPYYFHVDRPPRHAHQAPRADAA
jgi:hypothetical protein